MRIGIGLVLPAAIVAGAGCGVDAGAWDHVPIVEAWLDRFDLSALAVMTGTMQGDALLVFTEPDGNASSIPVHLGGGLIGAAIDLSADPEGHEGSVDIDLTDVDHPTVGDVFGTYHGTGSAGAMIAGGSKRRMRNGQGASFREDHFVLGIALDASYQWVTIREGGNDGQAPDDGAFPTFTGPDDSEDTGPFTEPTQDTGAQDTATPAQASSGCNEGTEPEPEPEPQASGGGGGGCASDSGCACSTGGTAAPLGLTGALLLLRFRRAGSGASTRSSRGSSAAR